jgi:copper chaperone
MHALTERTTMQTLHFDVDGMHCGGCAARVQRTLQQLDTARDVTVSLQPGRASVTVDGGRVSANDVVRAITVAGYTAHPRAAA